MRRRTAEIALLVGAASTIAALVAACGDDPPAPAEPLPDASAVDAGGLPEAAVPPVDAGPDADAGVPPAERRARFVVLGDFGFDDMNELAVANLVKAWDPEFVVTVGDNSYPESNAATIDETIGKYYASFIHPYKGKYGPGATTQRFYACLGNHDWQSGSVAAHEDYFELPNNERYWTIEKGPFRVHCTDSDGAEPDGNTAESKQGTWLRDELAAGVAAKTPFRLVVTHHPPHSSGQHGSQSYMQWPYEAWGAHAVYAGHDHDYERFDFGPGTIPFVVQGLGGADLRPMATSRTGSVVRYSEKHGATFVEADESYAVFTATTIALDRIDEHVLVSDEEERRPTESLLAPGAVLRFKDDGLAAPAGWTDAGFDASAWKSGPAPLGYGEPDVKTTMTTALVHHALASFDVPDPDRYHHAVVWLRRDDGAAVHVNGVELSRSNLPKGTLTPTTLARETVGFAAEAAWLPTIVPRSVLRAGRNVVAIELHQASPTSSDAVLDVRVEGKR